MAVLLLGACASTEPRASFTDVSRFPGQREGRTTSQVFDEHGQIRMHIVVDDSGAREVLDYIGTPDATDAGMPRELVDWVFGERPLEHIGALCCAYDVCDAFRGIRYAD